MSLGHLTFPTMHVEKTASFLEKTLGYRRLPGPTNSPVEVVWLDIGRGQSLHVFAVPGFKVSPFEGEFGRHFAVYFPLDRFEKMKQRLVAGGAEIFYAERPTPFERFFFREPVNGYVIEVIDGAQEPKGFS